MPGAGGGAEAARRKREEEFALRRKLGLRGKNGAGTAAKRGRAEDSESEEETGRSGVGRAKKVKARAEEVGGAGLIRRGGREERSIEEAVDGPVLAESSKSVEGAGSAVGAKEIAAEDTDLDTKVLGTEMTSWGLISPEKGTGVAKKRRKKKKNKT